MDMATSRAAPSLVQRQTRLLAVGVVTTALLHAAAAAGACGANPQVVYVTKGDKKRVRYWNTDVVVTSLDEELAEGSGSAVDLDLTDSLQPAAALIAAGVAQVTEPPQGAAETTPFVVTPAGPEAATETAQPVYDTQPHIVMAETTIPENEVSDGVVSNDAAVQDDYEAVKAGGDEADAQTEEMLAGQAGGIIVKDIASAEKPGEETIEVTTEREYMTTLDPYDLVAIENMDDKIFEGEKATPPTKENNENQAEGSGDGAKLPGSATIPLNKYQEIQIAADSADDDDTDSSSGDAPELEISDDFTVILEDNQSADGAGKDRLITVTGFNEDKVVVEWTPDEEASGNVPTEHDVEANNSDVAKQTPPNSESAADTSVSQYNPEAIKQKPTSTHFDTANEIVEDELPLSMLESGPVVPLVVESDTGAEDTDELLPLVQPNSIHQFLTSLPLSNGVVNDAVNDAGQEASHDVEEDVSASTYGEVDSDTKSHESWLVGDYPEDKTEDGMTELERLLLIQGFASGDRVILEHIPDPPVASGSAAMDDSDTTTFLVSAEDEEGSGEAQQIFDASYEASGDRTREHSKKKPAKVSNNWVSKEKHAVTSTAQHMELPDSADIEVQAVAIPVLKESDLPVASVEGGNNREELPIAETEGVPLPETTRDTNKTENSKEKDEGTKKSENETEKSSSANDPEPVYDSDVVSSTPETEDEPRHQTSIPLSRETLLNSIYRILRTQNRPQSRFTPGNRPGWAGFTAPRRRFSTAEPLPTEKTVIVGDGSPLLGGPYEPAAHNGASGQRREASSRRARSARRQLVRPTKPEQQQTSFDPVQSLRTPDDHLFRFIRSQPYPLMSALINGWPRLRSSRLAAAAVDCEWQIKTDPHLYLLVTLNNLGAPYTVNCDGAYIEVERERDGFEARWCGNRIKQSGSRPHMVFARGEVRIAVFNDGNTTNLPTGFEADVEVVDLKDARQYSTFQRSGLHLQRLVHDMALDF